MTTTATPANLTAKELEVLRAIFTNDFQSGDGHDWIWADSIQDCRAACTVPKSSLGGIVSSLVKKGLVLTDGWGGREACVKLTDAGIDVASAADRDPATALMNLGVELATERAMHAGTKAHLAAALQRVNELERKLQETVAG